MRPSSVQLRDSYPPLTGTFSRVEREVAATLMVTVMAAGRDMWRPVCMAEIRSAVEASEILRGLLRNPFLRPDFKDLADRGWAHIEVVDGWVIEFTPAGIDRMLQRSGFHLAPRAQ